MPLRRSKATNVTKNDEKAAPAQSPELAKSVIHGKMVAYKANHDLESKGKKAKAKLSKELKEQLKQHGTKTDTGWELEYDNGDKLTITVPTSTETDPTKAEEVLKAAGLWEKCSVTVTTIDHDKLAAYIQAGEISVEDVQKFTTEVPGSERIGVKVGSK